jgi:hypothetical protein
VVRVHSLVTEGVMHAREFLEQKNANYTVEELEFEIQEFGECSQEWGQ